MTGRVMCVSKSTKRLTWVVDGVPQYGFDVRFGSDELPTREGVFSVYKKKVDVISNLYHTPMPYSMFFSGGQAVHYSSNFARLGYSGASHGCVNVRNKPLLDPALRRGAHRRQGRRPLVTARRPLEHPDVG